MCCICSFLCKVISFIFSIIFIVAVILLILWLTGIIFKSENEKGENDITNTINRAFKFGGGH